MENAIVCCGEGGKVCVPYLYIDKGAIVGFKICNRAKESVDGDGSAEPLRFQVGDVFAITKLDVFVIGVKTDCGSCCVCANGRVGERIGKLQIRLD